MATAIELAKAFAEKLNEVLTAEQMEQVNDLNAGARYAGLNVCHSHDFCDANQVMLDALGEEFDNSDEQNKLINEAWEIAKRAEFSPTAIENDGRR